MGCGASSTKVQPANAKSETPHGVIPNGQDAAASSPQVEVAKAKQQVEQTQPEDEPGIAVEANNGGSGTSSHLAVSSDTTDSAWSRSQKQTKRVQQHLSSSESMTGSALADCVPDIAIATSQEEAKFEISQENRRFMNKVFQKHFLFSGLDDDEKNAIIDYMIPNKYQAGQVVFQQGDRGNGFYVIKSGTFTVSIDDKPLKQLKPKHTFGELALLYNVSRTATVSCLQAGQLWRLTDKLFRQCMKKLNTKHFSNVRSFLDADPTFSTLAEGERDLLAQVCSVQVFQRGDPILREGEVGDWMFIVAKGNVSTVDQYGNTVVKYPGTILGSTGLMYTKRQVIGAQALDNVTCMALGQDALERLIGPVEKLLRRSAVKSLIFDNVGGSKSGELDFFKHLTEEQRNTFIDLFEECTFEQGEVVITNGARAQFIIIIHGEVGIMGNASVVTSGAANNNVGQLKAEAKELLTAGMSYGATALLENAAMPGDLVALSNVRMHRVGHAALADIFKEPLVEVIRMNEIKKVLSDVFLFKNLGEEQINRTVRSLVKRTYKAKEIVVEQGEDAKHFFLIQSGVIQVSKDGEKLRTLGRWDYFGERGLLLKEKRSATCEAKDNCECLVLEASTFSDIVGTFRKDLEHRMYLQDLDITFEQLRFLAIVGRGTFGIVKLVCHVKDESKLYALKCVNKKGVVEQSQQKAIVVERDINAQCYHPCIMQFIKTFQDADCVYFLTEFLGGGDLFYAIREIGNLTKLQAQYFSASIVLALGYLHGRGILYRDLKPENVLLDFKGQAKLVDFGCCKKAIRTTTLVGTPEYLAPEVILGKGYTCAIDWWALGVILHEFIVGPLPFGRDSEDQLELFREILEAPLQFPKFVSDKPAVALIAGLLERTPEIRVGSSQRGSKELEENDFYKDFDWIGLASHTMEPPWTPDTEKLKQNWEYQSGELLGRKGSKNTKVEPGMEWASVF